jgi:hypothetical protein
MVRLAAITILLVAARLAPAQELVQAMPLSVAPVECEPDTAPPGVIVDPAAGEQTMEIDPLIESGPIPTWQILPEGILYATDLADPREPRFGSQWFFDARKGWLWDIALGGRVGVVRYGTTDPTWPEGWQLDVEGAAFPRLAMEEHVDLVSNDFRAGLPLTYRQGLWESKFGYYHLSSHLGDEFMLHHPERERINYSRDALLFGLALRPGRDWRLYGEVAWAFYNDGGSEPWEFQLGASYCPAYPTGFRGAPFVAVNGRLRQEANFGGNVTLQAGWAWRGQTDRLFRVGFHYLNGLSNQAQFFREFEQQIGTGIWYDF